MSTELADTELAKSFDPATQFRLRDLLLAGLTISSGAIDAISFLVLGKVFTAFMTGNIVFLGLAIAGNSAAPDILSVVSSMGGFAVGVYLATWIANVYSPATVQGQPGSASTWPLATSIALGVSLLAQAGFLVVWCSTSGSPTDTTLPVLLALWGLAMGSQSSAVRIMNVGGVFTTAATATYIFLVGDLVAHNVPSMELRRLVVVLASLCVGAGAGGLFLVYLPLYAPVLPFAITIAVLATAAVAFRTTRRQL